jgi:osmotically-inducible protein OsmY
MTTKRSGAGAEGPGARARQAPRRRRAAAQPQPVREAPRELYEGGVALGAASPSRAAAASSSQDAAAPLDKAGAVARPGDYAGEYEQRSPGACGTGPPGEIRSREGLLEALRRRLAEDPSLAGCQLRVQVQAQGVELVGEVADASQHARLRALAAASGIGLVTDSVRVRAPPGASRS